MTVALSDMKRGQSGVVSEIGGGQGIRQRLSALGVRPGDSLRVVRSAPFLGPVLVEIGGTELAIGRGMAQRIRVEPGGPP
jgi:ferrous iron transport protein A